MAAAETGEVAAQREWTEVPRLKSERPVQRQIDAAVPTGVGRTASQPVAEPAPGDLPKPVAEETDQRGADSRVFRNDDGSLTLDAYTSPIHYQDEDGTWVEIDNTIEGIDGRDGWVGTSRNEWSAAFGPLADGLEITAPDVPTINIEPVVEATGDGSSQRAPRSTTVSPRVVERELPAAPKSAAERAERSAIAEPGVVQYDDVWGDVDLRYEVRNSGLKEDIVIPSASSPSEFLFDVSGATFRPDGFGGFELEGPAEGVFGCRRRC